MNALPLHILLIEDNLGDARLVQEHLVDAPGKPPFTLDHAPSLAAAFNRLGEGTQPDVALLDLSLPDSHGPETLARLLETAPALPIIVLTGFDDEGSAVNAVREGAQDYLVKGRIDGNALFQSIRYAVERKRAAEALRRANEELERRVEERTAALRDSNAHLQIEINERKLAQAQIVELLKFEQQARAAVETANRTKDEFLATLSHELRTPLNAILGWAEILRTGDPTPGEVREGVEIIERNARAQARLVEDVLEVSRIICGKLRLNSRPLDFAEAVDAALASVRPAANAKGVGLHRRFDTGTAPVEGDADRLQQVVNNVLSNALKFTPPGGEITVHLRRREPDGSAFEVGVTDTGIGIRADFLPFVFDRFRQSDASSTRAHGGLGLGLSIARHLLEMHGGTIAVASEGESRGSTFTLTLPAAEPPPGSDGSNRFADGVGIGAGQFPGLPGVRALVVDDSPDSRRLVARLLRRCGADEVREAEGAAEAVAVLETFHANVLISDIAMPGEDGYSLMRRLRARPEARLRDLPAVALSAFARAEDKAAALEAGFQTHLPKPTEPADLVAAVLALTMAR